MSESQSKRNPWVAVALSLVSTGLGHVYCGRIVRGLVLFCASLLFAPFAFGLALIPAATPVLVVLILAFVTMIGLYAFAAIDARRLAKSSGESFTPRDYNRPIVYLVLGLVGLVYPPMAVTYLRGHVFEAFYVPSSSMAPTILDGDRILVNKVDLASKMPERGDIVIFHPPNRRNQNWIKRVIGLPGDRVEGRGGEVFVNGKKLERDRVPASHLTASGGQVRGEVFAENLAGRRYLIQVGGGDEKATDFPEKTVPEGCYFMLGDNRDNSLDSRGFGFVPRGEMIGEATYLYLPAESWSRFGILRP